MLGAEMMGVRGRIQRIGEIVSLIAHWLTNLHREFAGIRYRERTMVVHKRRG
ncbi:hypothetical protein [Aureimonas phyllosphaerae]|uniref:Uncharacterized protein n=1 Tax=Aureimonas phyllosphaerae TaxID=1166078 RepID=A0A7W6BYS1_9HYPH|nr:hypothetical protein [Aureimonas phyllosphaerae]MBB3937240.1 hypothetical protein [Aureimonas phyllosphaerae]MBB3961123.1 hypothetical protein [Aureimonas phyllosphaerae]SFF49295.1 hypothetical protein SAMN05216566_11768 [Aureimonas phyllosphaerae]